MPLIQVLNQSEQQAKTLALCMIPWLRVQCGARMDSPIGIAGAGRIGQVPGRMLQDC
jgi:hypothetical protein